MIGIFYPDNGKPYATSVSDMDLLYAQHKYDTYTFGKDGKTIFRSRIYKIKIDIHRKTGIFEFGIADPAYWYKKNKK